MSNSLRTRIRARMAACLASIAAAAILVTGVPAFQGVADAAPGTIRCDKKWLGKEYGSPPAGSGIQGKNQPFSQRPQNEWDDYWFENPSHAFDGLKAPNQAQSDLAGDTDADAQKWKKKFETTQDPKYRVLEIYARYNVQAKKSTGLKNWGTWLDQRLIGYEANRLKGDGFEAKVVRDFKLVGPDWICQKDVPVFDKDGKPVIDPKTGKQAVRKYDAYNAKTKEFVEFKSNGKHIAKQFRYDNHVLRNQQYSDHKLRLITGDSTSSNTVKKYATLNKQLEAERGKQNQATIREHRSTGAPRWRPNQYTRYNPIMNPDPRRVGSIGPINDAAFRSGSTPGTARQIQHQYRGANGNGVFGRGGPGGIDFSTLELNYVGSPVKGKGLDYSFKADYAKDPDNNPGWGGKAKLQLASDAMFTWLALTPDTFWVNLNPDQPDKIMDKRFGKTDAGRVLLEADLEMKHDYAKDMDPREGVGKQYWDAMQAANIPCGHQIRLWIVPETAKVRVEKDGIYILDAPLKVNAEPQKVEYPDPNGSDCKLTEAQIRTSQSLVDRYVIPDVEKKVNTGPAYADLRRVYSSRVAAEYIRDQDKDHATDFRPIINSNNVARWPLSAEHRSWTPKKTWDAYMKSYTEGDYSYPCNVGGQNKTCVMGGVDFSKAPKRNITRVRFDLEHPRLDKNTKTSVKTETAYRDTDTALIGGNGSGEPAGGGDGDPIPTPTPTPTDGPSTPAPSDTPSPQPSTPGGGDKPTPPAKDPDGDLADTGSSAPIGLIAGIAAALAAAGAALIWWMRRRKATTG